MKKAIISLTVAVLLVTTNIISFYLGVDTGIKEQFTIEDNTVQSQGERGTPIYTIEMWVDGSVIVRTTHAYIQEVKDNSLIISSEEVIK